MTDTPPMQIKVGNETFTAVEYWWEGNDFIFAVEDGQQYCCKNCYPLSIKWEGLECDTSESCEITLTKTTQWNNYNRWEGGRMNTQWTKELVDKLNSFVNHRDYVVTLLNCTGTVGKVTPVHEVPNPERYDTPGWFGFGPPGYGSDIEDDHDLADHDPSDFEVFERIEWQEKEPRPHEDD